MQGDLHECLEIDPIPYDDASSEDSDISDGGNCNSRLSTSYAGEALAGRSPASRLSHLHGVSNSSIELSHVSSSVKKKSPQCPFHVNPHSFNVEDSCNSSHERKISESTEVGGVSLEDGGFSDIRIIQEDRADSNRVIPGKKSLEGLCILLAEDTPVLQRVATIMLEKMGATVVAVGDGLQAVEALRYTLNAEECRKRESPQQNGETRNQQQFRELMLFDLILMDCQMPKMDGYEATKTIRKSEIGTGLHIPIVALTAHAMSSDEAKCLEVGMDAYLTKPINCKLMLSTILSLTKRTAA
ncbi:hypothetical protein MKW94_018872 [Papaver nudicaule]|uniref:Response regulatory domain-containing protein n=1 Tax=Papaver nudicaule TaxID=74823 RepID=A0AA41V8U3_PAPNU|nr:hypothetical protein [Papaver nudicaule]